MVNKIDKSEFKFINLDFIQRTNLRNAPASMDIDGKDSLKHLQNIIESDMPMIKTLCLEHAAVKETYRNATNVTVNNSRILEFHFIWGRMMLEFYYFYHDTKEEALKIIDKMLYYEGVSFIKEAVRAGIKLIDDYYDSEWNETIPDTPRTKKPQTESCQTAAPNPSALNQNPDILQLMQDINNGDVRHQDVDWEFQLKNLLFLCRLMPEKFPDVLLIWSILAPIDDPAIKMDIIGKLQEAAPKCFNSPFDAQEFIDDCGSIYEICVQARAYNLRNDIGIRHKWTDDRKDMNDLAHILSDKVVDPKFIVAMVEEMKRIEAEKRRHPMLEIVLKANRYKGYLSIDNIVDFAKRLYIAEGYRQMILSGQEHYREVPTLEKFSWSLRNKCFDIYIDIRKEQIKDLLNQDNTRVDGADDFEALQHLLREETAVVEKELAMYQDPSAMNMWYPGMKHVKDMITVFLKYLPKKIEKARIADNGKQATTTNMIFEGPVGQVIANVEHMHNDKE